MEPEHEVEPKVGTLDEARLISDVATLRALGHPVRLALLEALMTGPLTATEAAERIGQTPTTCSFHFRQLARYGFIEEAGGGRGRARPWRRTHTGWRIPAQPDDTEFTRSSHAVFEVMLGRYFDRIRRAILAAPTQPREWNEAMAGTESMLFITADEAKEVAKAYDEMLLGFSHRWGERTQHAETRPSGTRAVELLFFATPINEPPAVGS